MVYLDLPTDPPTPSMGLEHYIYSIAPPPRGKSLSKFTRVQMLLVPTYLKGSLDGAEVL